MPEETNVTLVLPHCGTEPGANILPTAHMLASAQVARGARTTRYLAAEVVAAGERLGRFHAPPRYVAKALLTLESNLLRRPAAHGSKRGKGCILSGLGCRNPRLSRPLGESLALPSNSGRTVYFLRGLRWAQQLREQVIKSGRARMAGPAGELALMNSAAVGSVASSRIT
jgi:hypothetical protein